MISVLRLIYLALLISQMAKGFGRWIIFGLRTSVVSTEVAEKIHFKYKITIAANFNRLLEPNFSVIAFSNFRD